MTNFVLSACAKDETRHNFCKNWDGKGETGDAEYNRKHPDISDHTKCPFYVMGKTNIGDPTWGVEEQLRAEPIAQPIKDQEPKPVKVTTAVTPEPAAKPKKKRPLLKEPKQINMI